MLIDTMTDDEFKWFRTLRERGFAVVVFTPKEVKDARSHKLEEYMVEKGWDYLADNGGEEYGGEEDET